MGFLFFGNKEKKNREAANANKNRIISLVENALLSCKNPDAITALRHIKDELQSQGETSDERALALDAEIMQLLTEANTFILKQQYPIAQTKLNKAISKAIDRHQYCIVGGQMTRQDQAAAKKAGKVMNHITADTKQSRAEELQSKIDAKNVDLEALQQEMDNLRKLHTANPNNASIIAQATSVSAKMRACKTEIDNLTIELNKETTDSLIADMATANEELTRGRTYSDDEMELKRATIQSQNEARGKTQEQAQANLDILGQGASLAFDPFAETANANVFDPFGDSAAATGAQAQSQQYGSFDASAVGTRDMTRDIAKMARALQDSLDAYTDKIDDANDDLVDYNAELKPLLERRKTASPADCLVLDGQIDQINAKRSNVIYKIKRYRQAAAQISDKLALIDKLATQQDLTETDERIAQLTGGKFSDFEGLSMFLKDSVKQSNEQLEEIGTAASVAESEEILMTSAAGASAALTDAGVAKDEDKYVTLEKELGMVR